MSHSRLLWLLPCFFLSIRGSGCADANTCMRHSDCRADARCIKGTCLVPPEPTAGSAGTIDNVGASANAGGTGGNSERTVIAGTAGRGTSNVAGNSSNDGSGGSSGSGLTGGASGDSSNT